MIIYTKPTMSVRSTCVFSTRQHSISPACPSLRHTNGSVNKKPSCRYNSRPYCLI